MRLNFKISNDGFTLLETVIGGVIAGVLIYAGVTFLSSSQRTLDRNSLKTRASSEIQSFFSNRRKSFSKVLPGALNPAGNGPFKTFTIPRTMYDSNYNPINNQEIITVVCGSLPTGLSSTDIPPEFSCPDVCGDSTFPLKVSIAVNNGTGDTAGEFYPSNNPNNFPTGEKQSQLAASLCIKRIDNKFAFEMTYLIRDDASSKLQTVSKTEVFTAPIDNGKPRPQVIGTGR